MIECGFKTAGGKRFSTETQFPLSLQFPDGNIKPHRMGVVNFNNYRDEQFGMRQQINQRCVAAGRKPVFSNDMDDFSKFHIIPLGDGFKIVKREKPLSVMEFDNDGHANTIQGVARTMSERIGLSRRRGKYNDADDRLVDNDTASIELGEVQTNGGGGSF